MARIQHVPSFGVRALFLAGALVAAPVAAEAALIATLSQISPFPTTYSVNVDFIPMIGSPLGSVTGVVEAVDLGSTSGCEASDFAGFAAGSVALLQRGACTFEIKALNAEAAGAIGVLVFNSPDAAVFLGSLVATGTFTGNIPVFGTTTALGGEFASVPSGLVVGMSLIEAPVTETPEPATAALFGLTVASLAIRHRARGGRRGV